MSKERLESIKRSSEYVTYREMGNDSVVRVEIVISENHFNWLIEQAERAIESEDIESMYSEHALKKHKQNKRYREALEFYASKEIHDPVLRSEAVYENGICISPPDIEPPIIYFDKGEKARKALEGEE